MLERRRRFLLGLGQRDPALDPVHRLPVAALQVGRAFGVGDAAARRHQVHLAGHDRERIALAVAVHDLAVEQVGHGRQPDVRVRAHVDAVSGDELHRAHLVEEDERPDHLALAVRQRAAHLEPAEIAHPRHDRKLQRIAGMLVAEHGVFVGHPAHDGPPSEGGGDLHTVIWLCGRRMERPRHPLGVMIPWASWPGLSRPPRLAWHGRALLSGSPGQARR